MPDTIAASIHRTPTDVSSEALSTTLLVDPEGELSGDSNVEEAA